MNAIQRLATEMEIRREKLKIWRSAILQHQTDFMMSDSPDTIIPLNEYMHKTRLLYL